MLYSQVRDRVGVDLSRDFKFGKDALPGSSGPVEQIQQGGAVFKPAVDSLPKERNNRVRRIAEQQDASFYVPRRALDGNHGTRWIRTEIGGQGWHKRHVICKP